MPDVDGQTVLHAAVKKCYSRITSILVTSVDPKGLQMENSVGNTPLDIISLVELNSRIQRFSKNQENSITELEVNTVEPFQRHSKTYISKLEKELPNLHAILDVLFADGRLKDQTKLATELRKFSSMMGERLHAAKLAEAARPSRLPKVEKAPENKNPRDSPDVEKTFSIVLAALEDSTVNRQLVHLIDVQKSVGADLETVQPKFPSGKWKNEDGPAPEQEENEKEKAQSMVWKRINLFNDHIV